MIKGIAKRFTSFLLTALLIIQIIPAMVMPSRAADYTPSGNFTYADYFDVTATIGTEGKGTASASGGTYTITATYEKGTCSNTDYTTTLTLTATADFDSLTVTAAMISGRDYSCTVKGTNLSSGSSTTVSMAKGQKIVLSIKSDDSTAGKATVTLSNVVVTVKNPDTVFSTPVNGSYTIYYAGESLAYDTVYQRPSSTNYQLVASPSEGYEFLGWYDENNNELSRSASFSYQGLENHTIRAIFMHAGSAVYYVKGAFGTFYDRFDLGIAATGNGGVLVVYKDGTLAGSTGQSSFSIPSGKTLLIPCDDAATVYTTEPRKTSTAYVAPTVFRTLTIPVLGLNS